MKRFCLVLVLMLLLAGCGGETEPVYETVADDYEAVSAEPGAVSVWMPDGAAKQTAATTGECYTWDECELRIETVDSGDIRATLERLTGLSPDRLTVMEYERDGMQMYQSVWSMTGEEGVTLGRCLVADDGNYHYFISLISPETADVDEDYAQICASLRIGGEEDYGK